MHKRLFLLIFLIFGYLLPLYALLSSDTSNIKFMTYTLDDGLLTNTVQTIFQDSRGNLWLGTQDGVNLFDGKDFKAFGEDSPLSSGIIYDICEDSEGNILFASYTGLYLYNPADDSLAPYHENLKGYEVHKVVPVTTDEVLVALRGRGLFKFSKGNLTPLLSGAKINDLAFNGNIVYVATDQGLVLYNLKDELTESVIESGLRISSLLLRQDALYAGTKDGILVLNFDGKKEFKNLSVSVTSLISAKDGGLWIGTASKGPILESQGFLSSRNFGESGTVMSMYLDRSDNLWIAYLGKGLKKVDIHRIGFSYLGAENGLDNTIVASLWEDRDESLWIGTFGGGLYHFSSTGVLIKHLASDPQSPGSPGDNRIMSLFRDSRDRLWLGTKSSGLYRYQNGAFTHVEGSYSSVYTVDEDKNGRIWAVTQGGGVHILSPDGTIERTLKAPVLPTLSFRTMLIRDDTVYLGSVDSGLILLDLKGNLLRHYSTENAAKGLNGSQIVSIFISRDGTLWVGTSGGGLHRYDPVLDRFNQISSKDGLPNNTVYGIVEDDEDRLWISTNRGLALFSPKTLNITLFSESDGLQSNEFNSGAAMAGRDSDIYMGGVKGLTYFNPKNLSRNETPPITLLSGISINNRNVSVGESIDKRVLLPQAIDFMDEIILTRNDLVVSLDLRSLHFSAPEKNTYAYYLEGLESDWNYTGTSIHSTYTTLSPGRYRFWYKSASVYGVWSPEKSITLIVKPRIYEYLIFKIGMALIILGIILFIINTNIKKAEEKRLFLENRVAARTRELEDALNREKKMRGILSIGEKMTSLVSLTVRLSHNLNTPLGSSLTAISFLKEHLERAHADQTLIDCCNMALEGTNQAVKIVRQLSSASNAQALPTPVMFNLSDVLSEYISQSWLKALEKSKIQCIVDLPSTDRYILGSISALQESMDSLIQNSLHHGFQGNENPEEGYLISLKVVYSEKEALLIYRDNGRGIDEDVQTKIFEPFEGDKGSGANISGMGLFLVYNLIKLQFSGSIRCVNDGRGGACFHIRLPLLSGKKV